MHVFIVPESARESSIGDEFSDGADLPQKIPWSDFPDAAEHLSFEFAP